jgi:capsular polysaccharide biosynthesis protein
VIKKILQKIFKKISYFLFFKIYGKIEHSIKSDSDKRIQVEIAKINENLEYKVYKIGNGRLYTDRIHDAAAILDNKIIEGPSFQIRSGSDADSLIQFSKISDNIVFTKGTPRKLRNLNGSVLSLLTGGAGNANYWHWLYDVLPKFELCKKFFDLNKIDFFLLPGLEKKFQRESLDFLKIPSNKRISSKKYRHIKAKELIITDHPVVTTGNATKDIENIPDWIVSWLKDNFLSSVKTTNKKNRIYIDRNDETSDSLKERFIINEEEIKKYLIKNNFLVVKLHNIHFLEQVNLFHNAECITGLHGGGFGNITFCEPRTKIIELKSLTAGNAIKNLAGKNKLNYNSISAEDKESKKNYFPKQQGSIHIPLNRLSKILES